MRTTIEPSVDAPSAHQTGAASLCARPAASRPLRALVVEDESLMRWSIAQTLGARGCQVVETGRGDAAIQVLSDPASAIDVVLLDLCLPDVCDLSLLERMRMLAPYTPIILMTVQGSRELVERAHDLGVFTVMDKPFDLNVLVSLIVRAIAESRLLKSWRIGVGDTTGRRMP